MYILHTIVHIPLCFFFTPHVACFGWSYDDHPQGVASAPSRQGDSHVGHPKVLVQQMAFPMTFDR